MGGILRNEQPRTSKEFSREEVLENTKVNAELGKEGIELREKLHNKPKQTTKYPKTKAPSALEHEHKDDIRFDEQGIEEWNKHRGEAERILEPNTPYMGTAADTEYYDEVPELNLEQ